MFDDIWDNLGPDRLVLVVVDDDECAIAHDLFGDGLFLPGEDNRAKVVPQLEALAERRPGDGIPVSVK